MSGNHVKLTITLTDGTTVEKEFDVMDGAQGPQGPQGPRGPGGSSATLDVPGEWKDEATGLIRKWGVTDQSGDVEVIITFDEPFPNDVFIVNCTRISSGSSSPTVAVRNLTTTGFNIRQADSGSSGGPTYWEAIGY